MQTLLRPVWLALATVLLLLQPAAAAAMRDDTLKIDKRVGLFTIELSARLFTPPGPGPFALVVINHGKAPGNAHLQKDQPYYFQAREFVKRGYAVLVPTREGFGSSGGNYRSVRCDAGQTGERQADDIELAIDYARTLPYLDTHHIVVIGQSVGGLATLALGKRHPPGVVGLIDMAGGIRFEQCAGWQQSDIAAFADYGAQSRIPVLMMYGDNDAYWGPGPDLPRSLYQAYHDAGGNAQFVDYGEFKHNSHSTFSDPEGMPLWEPSFRAFFASLNLPFDERVSLRSGDAGHTDIEDSDAIPAVSPQCRSLYRTGFLGTDPKVHRAYAISGDGHCGYANGDDAEATAKANCARYAKQACATYATDETVIYHRAENRAP